MSNNIKFNGSYFAAFARNESQILLEFLLKDVAGDNCRTFVNLNGASGTYFTLEGKSPGSWLAMRRLYDKAFPHRDIEKVIDFRSNQDTTEILCGGNVVSAHDAGASNVRIDKLPEIFEKGTGYLELTQKGLEQFFEAAGKAAKIKSILDDLNARLQEVAHVRAAAEKFLQPVFGNVPLTLEGIKFESDASPPFIVISFSDKDEDKIAFAADEERDVVEKITNDFVKLLGDIPGAATKVTITSYITGDMAYLLAINIDDSKLFEVIKEKIMQASMQILSKDKALTSGLEQPDLLRL